MKDYEIYEYLRATVTTTNSPVLPDWACAVGVGVSRRPVESVSGLPSVVMLTLAMSQHVETLSEQGRNKVCCV